MKDYSSDNPKFLSSIRVVEVTDPVHADNVNASVEQLAQNDFILAAIHSADLVESAFRSVFPNIGP